MAYKVEYIPKTKKDFEMISMAFGISIEKAIESEYEIDKITKKDILEKKKANKEVFKKLKVLNEIDNILIEKNIIDTKNI